MLSDSGCGAFNDPLSRAHAAIGIETGFLANQVHPLVQ
jgi:hypothetical protein